MRRKPDEFWYLHHGAGLLAGYLYANPFSRSLWLQALWMHAMFTGIGLLMTISGYADSGLVVMIGGLCASLAIYMIIWAVCVHTARKLIRRNPPTVVEEAYKILYEALEEGE